ncbi:tetratricopeptide repeat protein [Spongiivirga citrea]|uniref:Tetratricopeptide repeat protein n=1 Tax=Spongiivirga citrea TaxID=1481457 RepID=A0A6M0CKW3_9FLAO|nr:tetratricopeptide repeat protein [Spongiivirga citrea]NER18596.1 tetratricopeptide repeat protein [Spongiivirga citrea]
MTYRKFLGSLFLLLGLFSASAQQSKVYTFDLQPYNEGLTLYNNKQYQASQAVFQKIKKQTKDQSILADCDYYIANCAIRLSQPRADKLMEAFVENHPTSIKRNAAFMDVADYYFSQGKYAYALKWYNQTNASRLSNKEEERFNFNIGYCYFTTKQYGQAEKYFNQLIASKEYGSQAKYYKGFMAYQGDDYQTASSYFDEVSGDDRFNKKLSYYQADMNFKLGNFEKAIGLAEKQLKKGDRKEKSELSKIIGESYFNLSKYNEAIPYLEGYKGKRNRWNNVDYYQLGYAYYKQKDYPKAISQFNKIVGGKNAVAQNAYYHLGECYLNVGKKQEALNAFKNASAMDFEPKIQEDAWLNYAKLSYEIGNAYKPVPEVLNEYIERYPKSQFKDEINELLISSYITSKNYEAALDLIEKGNNYDSKATYQKVAFYRAIEVFNEGNYKEAIDYFDKSLKNEIDVNYTARALYWKAEADYRLKKNADAVIGFKQFLNQAGASQTEEFKEAHYNLGYAYFKQKNYTQAIGEFNTFIKSGVEDESKKTDAYLRLGDCNFVSSKYWPAIEAYNSAINNSSGNVDYAYFQKAISYGFLKRNDSKIKELNTFINARPRSTLKDDALFELGNTYIAQKQNQKGIAAYDQLISEYKGSSYASKALLKQGLVYYNTNDNNNALAKFKTVARDYPGTPEANAAVSSARLVYVDMGNVDEYARWVKGLDFVEITDSELENTTFEAAEKQFQENNMVTATKSLRSYLKSFPNGSHAYNANFMLGQALFEQDKKGEAILHYQYVVNRSSTDFTEPSLARLSQIYLEQSDYQSAKPLLMRLENEAGYPQNISFAQSNLMKANYELKDYATAVAYAEKVLSSSKIDKRLASDAKIIIARSAIKTGDEAKARSAYSEVLTTATGRLAAEALYYEGYFKHKDGAYEESNKTIQKLVKDYSSNKEFAARGLIIMAKNFDKLDDAFQATYVLESVIKNFTQYQEIVTEAKTELQRIKTKESKRNESVSPDGNR